MIDISEIPITSRTMNGGEVHTIQIKVCDNPVVRQVIHEILSSALDSYGIITVSRGEEIIGHGPYLDGQISKDFNDNILDTTVDPWHCYVVKGSFGHPSRMDIEIAAQ